VREYDDMILVMIENKREEKTFNYPSLRRTSRSTWGEVARGALLVAASVAEGSWEPRRPSRGVDKEQARCL